MSQVRTPPDRGRSRAFAAALAAAVIVSMAPAGADEDIRIIRDGFGVPHVFASTTEGVSYGAGYALAQDRLWQMHVFRHIGKGRLSDLFGPTQVGTDKTVRFFTYTPAERAARFATYPDDIRRNLRAFVDGINAWIGEVRLDPRKLPVEFVEFASPLTDWTIDDTISLQDVLILAFGSGGGNELRHAQVLSDLVTRYGDAQGLQMWSDLIVPVDDDGPMTIPRGFDYVANDDRVREADVAPRRFLTTDARLGISTGLQPPALTTSVPVTRSPAEQALAQLRLIPDVDAALRGFDVIEQGLATLQRMFSFGSNAQIAGPQHAEAGNALQTAGPQVGYLLPQWLADFGLHGGGIDTTGMTFAGAGPAVLIGRGKGYAWTTTTGASDLTDTYVETLNTNSPREYLFNGVFEPMECRTEVHTFRGAPFDTQEICRTRHGPVASFDTANGRAYSLRYAWFNREVQTVEGFFRYNEVKNVEDFATFANFLSSNHNMFYADDKGNYGFWHPGNHPVRKANIDIRLPQDGTGFSEWEDLLPVQQVPHAVNFERGWLANWNNQPAEGWKRERGHPALDNAMDLERTLDPAQPAVPDPSGGVVNPDRLLDFEDLSANLRYAAFKHHNDTFFRPFLPQAASLSTQLARDALGELQAWDGFLVDRNADGLYDSGGKAIIDRWVSTMKANAFNDDLKFSGKDLTGWSRDDLLWHIVNPGDTLLQGFAWVGAAVEAFKAQAFEQAAAGLAADFKSQSPSAWREKARLTHYQRINADLLADLALGTARQDNSRDSGLPGDVADHIAMDRGTYNHVVVYKGGPALDGPLGQAASEAGSVIPPGQNGFVDLLGREGPHFEDQLALYVGWTYKPMPLTLEEALAIAESDVTLTR